MSEIILDVSGLEKYYGEFHALKGVDVRVRKGEIFGLLGPNGAGKTTLLRTLVGLIKPHSGSIEFFGKYGLNQLDKVLGQVGCIIEEPRFFPYLSGKRNLQVSALYYPQAISNSKIEELVRLVGLGGREGDKVKTYSQGMRQRLGIAQAMLSDPEIIILDEPTNGLDPKGIIELRELIVRLKEEFGKTIIISSHILSEVEQMADSMAIIDKGVCVSQGQVSDLLSRNKVTVSMETNDPAATKIMLEALEMRVLRDRQALTFQTDLESIPLVVEKLTGAGQKIFRLDHRRKLEDYFLKLTAA